MRVLLVDLSKRFGGVDVRVAQMALADSPECRIASVVLDGSKLHHILASSGLEVFAVKRSRYDPLLAYDIASIARRFSADIVDAHNPQSQLWGTLGARLAGVAPIVATVHTVYRTAHRGVVRQIGHEQTLRIAKAGGAHFIGVSGSICAYLRELRVREEFIHLSYNAIEPVPSRSGTAELRASLGIPPDAILLGIVGRVELVKGHDVLLEALSLLARHGRTYHVVIAGEGRDEQQVRKSASALGLSSQVHFLGFRADVDAVMRELDILCLPSRSEGLPYVALEGARLALPIVATRVDGLAEIFTDDRTAIMIPPEDPLALARTVERLANDEALRRRIGACALEMTEQRFGIRRMVDETLAVYALACSSGAKRIVAGTRVS